MVGNMPKLAVVFGMAGLIMISPVSARDSAPPLNGQSSSPASAAAPGLVVSISVARDRDRATYSITLRNSSDTDVKDIFIAGAIAPGTTFIEAGPNPAKSGFRAVQGNAAVWLSEVVPAGRWAGPFAYRVKLSGDTADEVTAWAHWRSPNDGTALSAPIRVLPPLTTSTLASGPIDRLPDGPLIWRVTEAIEPAQVARPVGHAPAFSYLLEGVETLGDQGRLSSYGPGAAFFHGPQHTHINRGDGPARSLGFSLSPAATRGQPQRPGSSLVYETEELTGLKAGPYTAAFGVIEAQPGAGLPTHDHSGPGVYCVVEGTVTNNLERGSVVYGPGGCFLKQVGEPHSVTNSGSTVARLLSASVRPDGEPGTIFTTGVRTHPWGSR
ncbi:MAG: cupin domain-containing protein [Chloroflexota bacterium]